MTVFQNQGSVRRTRCLHRPAGRGIGAGTWEGRERGAIPAALPAQVCSLNDMHHQRAHSAAQFALSLGIRSRQVPLLPELPLAWPSDLQVPRDKKRIEGTLRQTLWRRGGTRIWLCPAPPATWWAHVQMPSFPRSPPQPRHNQEFCKSTPVLSPRNLFAFRDSLLAF